MVQRINKGNSKIGTGLLNNMRDSHNLNGGGSLSRQQHPLPNLANMRDSNNLNSLPPRRKVDEQD